MDYTATTQALALCIAENVSVILWGKPGHGKALDIRTPIPTPDGWSTMKDLKTGDKIFDEMGNHIKVLATYPQPEGRECFLVLFDDGSVIIADADHLWETSSESSYSILTTKQILDSMNSGVEHYIPLSRPLCGEEITEKISPYEAGVKTANLIDSDSLPVEAVSYLRASFGQRRELLRGILDTVGFIDQKNSSRITIYSESELVNNTVHELCCSLGYKARKLVNGYKSWTVSFLTKDLLFSDGHTVNSLPQQVPIEEEVRKIVSISPHEEVEMKCITVDSASSLYLAGESMIPTHNTSVIQHICKSYGIHLETVIASIREPSDFAGLPYFENGMTRLAAPSWVHSIIGAATGDNESKKRQIPMVFYDEISTAPPATQAALLRPILEGVVGEVTLPPSTRSVAAANPPGIAADGWDFSPPAANRFTHLDWELDASTVKEGFTTGWPLIDLPSLAKPSVRRQYTAHAKALVGTFLGRHTQLVDDLPENFSGVAARGADFKASSYAFPSPRSWEMAARLYAAWLSASFSDGRKAQKSVIHLLLVGTVGMVAAKQFLAFAEALDLPDPAALLKNPASYSVPDRGDQLDVLLSSLVTHYLSNPTPQNWSAWGDILATTVESGKGDIAYAYMNKWNSLRPDGVLPSAKQSESLQKLLTELSPRRS